MLPQHTSRNQNITLSVQGNPQLLQVQQRPTHLEQVRPSEQAQGRIPPTHEQLPLLPEWSQQVVHRKDQIRSAPSQAGRALRPEQIRIQQLHAGRRVRPHGPGTHGQPEVLRNAQGLIRAQNGIKTGPDVRRAPPPGLPHPDGPARALPEQPLPQRKGQRERSQQGRPGIRTIICG